jgi:hypothetical protein
MPKQGVVRDYYCTVLYDVKNAYFLLSHVVHRSDNIMYRSDNICNRVKKTKHARKCRAFSLSLSNDFSERIFSKQIF